MNFSKTTAYALTVLNLMAGHEGDIFSAMRLHRELNIPWPYLRKLLTGLTKSGLITSRRGRNGGFYLARDTCSIFIADIVDAVEGLDVLSNCIMGLRKCPFDHHCALHDVWGDTRQNILNVLKNTSLAYLINRD